MIAPIIPHGTAGGGAGVVGREGYAQIDRKAEHARMLAAIERLIPDPEDGARVFRGIRSVCARQWQRSPNWVLAMKVYGQGSTYSWAICRRLGIDPDSRSAASLAPATPAQAETPRDVGVRS